jgi:HPt (histidine-containing phosphotransfer) domain-containing protein
MRRSKNTAAVVTYGDHEVITPENKLRGALSKETSHQGNEDPIARAEKALAELSPEFASWMDSECHRLDQARIDLLEDLTKSNLDALFHAAHDIKGEAATFGYPALASAADSLCRLIEHTPGITRIPQELVDQHVNAVRAIYREYERSDAKQLAANLTMRLRDVTNEFLHDENRDRPEVLEQLRGPTLVPELAIKKTS